MIVQAVSDSELSVFPETEVESFYVTKFLKKWRHGIAKVSLKSGVMAMNPQMVLEFRSPLSYKLLQPIEKLWSFPN